MFLKSVVERYEIPAEKNSGYVTRFPAMPYGEKAGVFCKAKSVELYSHKPSKDCWLGEVNGEDDKLLFQKAYCWDGEMSEKLE